MGCAQTTPGAWDSYVVHAQQKFDCDIEPTVRARPGRLTTLAFPRADRFCVARLYGRAGRLTAESGGFRPGGVAGGREGHQAAAEVSDGAYDRASPNFMGLASLALNIGVFCDFL